MRIKYLLVDISEDQVFISGDTRVIVIKLFLVFRTSNIILTDLENLKI